MGAGVYGAEGSGVAGVGRGSGTCLCGRAFGRRVCGAVPWLDSWAVVGAGLRLGLCRRRLAGSSLAAACGWCFGLWSWVACGARAWAYLRVYGAEGLLRSGACCRCISGAGHGSPLGRDRCGRVVFWLVWLRRPFGWTFLSGALWRAGPRWCRNARSPCGVVGLRSVW